MEQIPTPEEVIAAFGDDTYWLPEATTPLTPDTPVGTPRPDLTTRFPFDPGQPLVLVDDSEWTVELEWAVVEGRFECVGMRLWHATAGRPLTTTLLRRLLIGSQIARWREQMIVDADVGLELADDLGYSEALRQRMRANLALAQGKRHRYPPEHFEMVATVYDQAYRSGLSPTKAVQHHFNELYGQAYSRSAAAKWVMACRRRGLLPATDPRVPAANPPQQGEPL